MIRVVSAGTDDEACPGSPQSKEADLLSGYRLWRQQFRTCMEKRFLYTIRNWKQLLLQFLLPIIFLSLSMAIAQKGNDVARELRRLELSTVQYMNESKTAGTNVVPVADQRRYDDSKDASSSQLLDTLSLPSGLGAHCVTISKNPLKCSNVTFVGECRELARDWKAENWSAMAEVKPEEVPCSCNETSYCPEPPGIIYPNKSTITKDTLSFIGDINETLYIYETSRSYIRSR